MKSDTHPTYAPIVFRDLASGETFLTRSTAKSEKTIELDGETYPVIDVEIDALSIDGETDHCSSPDFLYCA